MRVRKIDDLFHRDHYLQCQVVTLDRDVSACYAIIAVADLPAERYQPLRRHAVVEVPYTGKLYTLEEVLGGAWKRDV